MVSFKTFATFAQSFSSYQTRDENNNAPLGVRNLGNDPDSLKEKEQIHAALQKQNVHKEKGTPATSGSSSPNTIPPLDNEDDELISIERKSFPHRFIPLRMSVGSHTSTEASASLLEEIGGVKGLQSMTDKFYEKAFEDVTLDKFIRSHEDPHGHRFATWIHQKLGGEGELWSEERASRPMESVRVAGGQRVFVHDRSSAHVAAWHSPKRPVREVGRHFKLDECRVWMRLHFWAMREAGLPERSPSFCDYYVRFIGHFVSVYESKAPFFAREALRWSEDPNNTKQYLANNRTMTDVLGIPFGQHLAQIPDSEAEDYAWPYIENSQE